MFSSALKSHVRSTRLNSGACTYRRSTSCSPHHLYVINHSTRHSPHGERINCREKVKPVLFLSTLGIDIYPVGFYAVRFSGKHCPKSVGVVSDSVISFFGGFNIWKGKGSILFCLCPSAGGLLYTYTFVCVEGFAPDSTKFKKVEEDAAATPDISYLYTTVIC
ncbi:uncharacterized protein C8R40DRAFT_692353 [Lentinula edodes]|uniref:uncharacterized protein n=1 Tax=Lentinula edodes TaxID=5353 RepID=UPI001E8E6772|nr:uncharacterized protein C8R40DRAFT_692353 [Lentinula edodes]KAH7878976.1 hypothetical protein C8R40DRAFT_692353 [Lentinula edodes]